jgi:hypothetical protein
MTPFDRARSGAHAAIEEVVANMRVRQSFATFILGQAGDLFNYAADKPHVKEELRELMKLKSADPSVVYRGLLIQLNGAFESFVKSLVSSRVTEIATSATCFDDLEEDLRLSYAAHAGRTLSKVHDGTVNGVSYDFSALQKNLGGCFSGVTPFALNGEVFTLQMGNCTPDRLEKVFAQVRLPDPFGDPVGRHKAIQAWCREGKARRAATLARDELELQIETRNNIVHGLASKEVVPNDIERAAVFFAALIDAFTDAATTSS